MQNVIWFLGGISLLFLGMKLLSNALSRVFKPKPGRIGGADGFLTGLIWTISVQSSSAVTAFLVSMTQAGIYLPIDCFPMLLGANVGTTLTVWLLSGLRIISINGMGLIPAVAAFLFSKKEHISNGLLGLSLVLLGMDFLQTVTERLKDLTLVLQTPWQAFWSGLGITAVLQSSAATIGALQAIPELGLRRASFAILGANIGTSTTGILASLALGKVGRKTAMSELWINILTALLMLPLAAVLPDVPASPVKVAAAHTLFNALTAAILLPCQPLIKKKSRLMLGQTG